MILGISASGRAIERNETGLLVKGVIEDLVKFILKNSDEPTEYISLGGKQIYGCQACLKCASNNVCVMKDDWAGIMERVFEADAVVFGAPTYYGTINAIGHAFLERTFSLRHQSRFPLLGKSNVIVTTGIGEIKLAEEYIQKIFRSNYMAEPIGILRASGIAQCYTCGYGEDCTAGAVVHRHGFLDEIRGEHIPRIPAETYQSALIIAKRLGSIIRANSKSSIDP